MNKKIFTQAKLTIIDQLSIKQYLSEMSKDKYAPITREKEITLFEDFRKTGNSKTKELIINANMRWVISVAKQYDYPKIRFEDLINEGNIGMIHAIDKFDHNRGVSFYNFATLYIRTALTQFVNETAADISQPANRKTINNLLKTAKMQFINEGNHQPSDEELLERYSIIKEKTHPVLSYSLLQEIKHNTQGFVSASTTLNAKDMENVELQETFKSGNEYNADYVITLSEKQLEINQLLSKVLSEKEKQIIELSFGLNGCEAKTLEQISEINGLTRERCGQLLKNSLKTLKKHKQLMFELLGAGKDSIHSIEK